MTDLNVIKNVNGLPGTTGDANIKKTVIATGEDLEADLHAPKSIFLGTVNFSKKQTEITLEHLPPEVNSNNYTINIDDEVAKFYEFVVDRITSVGGRTVRGTGDIEKKENMLYIWNQYNAWEAYEIRKEGKEISLLLRGTTKYNPLKAIKKPVIDKRGSKFTIIEYENPSTSKGEKSEGKILICHDFYGNGKDLPLKFPHKEGVIFDDNSVIMNGYGILIYDIQGKLHTYRIRINSDELVEAQNN